MTGDRRLVLVHVPVTLPAHAEARLAELGDEYGLRPSAIDALAALIELIAVDPLAPTAVRDRAAALDVHIADSLVALELDAVREARTIADLGSGAGVPGLVLASVVPSARVWLVESNRRKCDFIARAIDAIGVDNAVVVNERAETWVAGRGVHELVTARALAPLAVVAEYAAPLLVLGGTLVAWTGARDPDAEAEAAVAAGELGMSEPLEPLVVRPFPASERRHLHLMSKVSPTPARYPRRPGLARKRPLGATGRSGRGSDRPHR